MARTPKGLEVKIDGRDFTVVYRRMPKNHGLCDHPKTEGPALIRLDSDLKKLDAPHQKRALATAIHEANHAADWQKDEAAVKAFAEAVGDLLWRLGWRRIPELSEIG